MVSGAHDPQDIDESARQICERFTCSISVDSRQPQLLGTGTVILIGEYVAIATAMHVVEGHDFKRLQFLNWYPTDDRRTPIPQDHEYALDERTDVAVLTMSREVLNGSTLQGLSLSQLQPTWAPDPDDRFLFCGCPCERSRFDTRNSIFTITYEPWLCNSLDSTRWPSSFEAHVEATQDPYEPCGSSDSAPSKLIPVPTSIERDIFLKYGRGPHHRRGNGRIPATNPSGFSGGGIWRIPRIHCGPDIAKHARLVGISLAVEKHKWQWIRGIQISYWLKLLCNKWPGFQRDIKEAGLEGAVYTPAWITR